MTIDLSLASRMRRRLYDDVGAIFANTRRDLPGVCQVCTGPATASMCGKCRKWQRMFGDLLADLVVPLAYAKSNIRPQHQSQHHMRQYKAKPPAAKCANDLGLMMGAAAWLHARCLGDWQVVTFVPSATNPGPHSSDRPDSSASPPSAQAGGKGEPRHRVWLRGRS